MTFVFSKERQIFAERTGRGTLPGLGDANGPHLSFRTGEENKLSARSYLQAVSLTSHPWFGQTGTAVDTPDAGCYMLLMYLDTKIPWYQGAVNQNIPSDVSTCLAQPLSCLVKG